MSSEFEKVSTESANGFATKGDENHLQLIPFFRARAKEEFLGDRSSIKSTEAFLYIDPITNQPHNPNECSTCEQTITSFRNALLIDFLVPPVSEIRP